MKKIDLMLKLLFIVAFVNTSYGQVGPFPASPDCAGASAFPIVVDVGYEDATPFAGGDNWYEFTAPADGVLGVTNCPYGTANNKRIWGGTCGAPVLYAEALEDWTGDCDAETDPGDISLGDVVYLELENNWNNDMTFDVYFFNPDCPDITALTSFASDWDEGTIGWFAGGTETTWIVKYGPAGFDPETEGTTVVDDDGIPVITIDGLEELTCYDVYVTSDCGGGEVGFPVGPTTFCTPAICPTPLAPFEDGITNTEATLNWTPGDSEVMWDVEWGPEGFVLGSGTFVDDTPFPTESLTSLEADSCYDWYVRAVCEVDLGDGPEIVNSLWVGPEEFCTNKNCLTPTDLNVISAPGLTATVGWTENNVPPATEWNIQYGEPGFTLGTGTTITNVPTNPFTITGLTAGTDYEFYVQSVCGETEDSLSNWSESEDFTTGIYCPAPTSLIIDGSSATEATLNWTPGGTEAGWTVIYGEDGFDPATEGTSEDVAVFPSLSLTGLEPGVTYCYYVYANCTADGLWDEDSSSLALTGCLTQDDLCNTPIDIEVINITNTAFHVNPTSPGAVSYDYEWGLPCFEVEAGEEIGSVDGTTDDPYYVTGLEASTPYWVYVRSICGVDSVSAWTLVQTGTQIANDDPCEAETLVLDADPILRHNFNATTLPGEGALEPDAAGCFDSDGWCSGDGVDRTVWFKFVAPESGQVVVSTFDTSSCVTSSNTEIALYTTGDCLILDNFTLQAANTSAPESLDPPYGSELTACGLTPGETYYVMVNPISYIETDITFGISLSSVEEVAAGLGLSPTICAGAEYDLFTSIAGFSTEDGQWYNPSVAPGNELDNNVTFPDLEASFDFFYVVENGCEADTVMTTITTADGVNAGGDGFYTACNTYDIVLSDHIAGSYDGGGIWEYTGDDTTVALAGGLFSPLAMTPGTYKFIYTVTSEYCPTDTACVTVTLTDCLGNDEEELNNLVVYPNPVVDVLTVQNVAIDGNAVIEVLDIKGGVVYSENVANVYGNYTIDMTRIESGVYFVKVTTENSAQKVRVVKQ